MTNLLIPIAGRSSRFPDMKPKWMLTHPRGHMMVIEAIKGLDLASFSRIYFIGLQQHEDQYNIRFSLEEQLDEL